ncbi:hypothetical protein MPDQ_005835 [Monascus purpureus]|uniref:Hemerythrin-like domain-containing protein n=1 Tax=Monascus purpureus TaxID=5098 RepID=A0A507QZQ9_MONPU|nr:hypothetical protein MPDQ_005835 [Monascus purpureus]BDD61008.1 hypothetical protein MAP00_006091 [Monascus purpureus]
MGPMRISDRIKQDHREIESLYQKIIQSSDTHELVRLQNMFTWELARHAVGEELVLYPAFEKYMRDGKDSADKDRREHKVIKDKLRQFQELLVSDARFHPYITSLMEDLSKHIQEEEEIDLVRLEQAITDTESEKLSKSFSRTKIFVPTRSHPGAPDKPPFETAVGLLMAPIDRLQNIFRKWPSGEVTPDPSM